MPKPRRFKLFAVALIAIAASASTTGPATSGTKSLKKHEPKAEPCKWGTPGCPYPSFGTQRILKTAPGGDCGKGMYKGGDGQCYPKLN
jgi:hypothetical protein